MSEKIKIFLDSNLLIDVVCQKFRRKKTQSSEGMIESFEIQYL